jgi:hypothetical protein
MPNIRETWQDPDDEWDNEEDDFEEYGEDEDEDEEPIVTCPYCRAEVWEEASQCPECGEYLSLEDQQARHQWQPRWIVFTAALLLGLILLGYLAGLGG